MNDHDAWLDRNSDPKEYDVVAVDLVSHRVRLIARSKSFSNAEAIVKTAVMRRGVEEEFFAEIISGSYQEGDKWEGHHA